MAELKFDMQRLAADVMEKVLDETEYKGRTLRDWIDGIASGEYVQAKSGRWLDVSCWEFGGKFKQCIYKCSCCGYEIRHEPGSRSDKRGGKFCDDCGARMDGDNND